MIQKIRVKTVKGKAIKFEGGQRFETIKVYRVEDVSDKEAKVLAEKLFCEEINQIYSINKPIADKKFSVVEIAYRPGVMNPEVSSIIKAANDLGIYPAAVDSSCEYMFLDSLDKDKAKEIVTKFRFYNPLIEHIVDEQPKTLLIKGTIGPTLTIPIRKMSNGELLELSKDKLFLNLEEIKVIQNYFQKIKRDPTDLEIETLAQTWSEHSGHKTFKAKLIVDGKEKEPLISRLKKEALKHKRNIVSAFVDNAGVMDFYDGWAINGKGETHNAPSAIEPYGGTMTGNGGVFRDIVATGQGAKTLMSADIFCLASPNMDKSKLPLGTLPPDYMLKRVVAAVRDYDNRVGIPTNNGSFHFHDDFRAKPTVLVSAYGILPKKYAKKGTPKVGDVIVSIGGRVGRDGIHGATFSSAEMTERTINVNAQAVQIGNAIEEKRMFDAVVEARDKNYIRAIQDSGGGGLSSAIGEMGEKTGVTVQLKNERLKYQGLSPWEIWLSESQERMILAITKEKLDHFKKVCKKYNVEVSVLGNFDGSRKLQVFYGKEKVCDLEMEFLHHGLPQRTMTATKPTSKNKEPKLPMLLKSLNSKAGLVAVFQKVLSHGNICSKEPILRMYDHTVQATNTLPPFAGVNMDAPNDAVVIRPILNKKYGMIVSHGLNPILNRIDPYWGSIWACTEAISNYASVGGNYKDASIINNYIWPFPDEEFLWSLDKSVDAVCDFMKTLKIPVISGKDSLSATYRSKNLVIHIPPTLCISVFGKIPDVSKTVSSDFKKTGSIIVLVGKQDLTSMDGSIYIDLVGRQAIDLRGTVPQIDLKLLPKVLDAIYSAIQTGKVLSCHDISEGGLITTLFEMCLGGGSGANITIPKDIQMDNFLFNETAGVFLVEVLNEKTAEETFKDVPHIILGKTKQDQMLSVENIFNVSVEQLKTAWQKPMKEIFG